MRLARKITLALTLLAIVVLIASFAAEALRVWERVPSDMRQDHLLRVIRGVVNATLVGLSGEFDALYSSFRRTSILPERSLRALLPQAFHSIGSERQLVDGSSLACCFAVPWQSRQ